MTPKTPQSIQNDQVDVLLSKGVKALAINLVDPAAAPTIISKAKPDNIPVVFFNKDPGAKAIGSYEHAYYVGTDPKESGLIQGINCKTMESESSPRLK